MFCTVIQTRKGGYFDFTDFSKYEFNIEDIAFSLSNINRFTGYTRYSVAQHSVLVSRILPDELKLEGLLHDAAESVVGDVASPLKNLLPDYCALEKEIEKVLLKQFGLEYPLDYRVKIADTVLLATERRDLLEPSNHPAWDWLNDTVPLAERISVWSPVTAEKNFLREYRKYARV